MKSTIGLLLSATCLIGANFVEQPRQFSYGTIGPGTQAHLTVRNPHRQPIRVLLRSQTWEGIALAAPVTWELETHEERTAAYGPVPELQDIWILLTPSEYRENGIWKRVPEDLELEGTLVSERVAGVSVQTVTNKLAPILTVLPVTSADAFGDVERFGNSIFIGNTRRESEAMVKFCARSTGKCWQRLLLPGTAAQIDWSTLKESLKITRPDEIMESFFGIAVAYQAMQRQVSRSDIKYGEAAR